MKKYFTVLIAIAALTAVLSTPAMAEETTNPVSSFFSKLWKFNDDVNAKIDDIQAKNEAQQKKFEAKQAERERKILEEQKKRQELYEANQKRLEEKKEQLRILLEE